MMRVGSNRRSSARIARPKAWPRSSPQQRRFWVSYNDHLSCGERQAGAYLPYRILAKNVKRLLTIGSILLCLVLPARAQNETPAPFDPDLERLSEILGAL